MSYTLPERPDDGEGSETGIVGLGMASETQRHRKMEEKIREIYDCTLLAGDDPLVIWYNHVIDKTVAELTAADVARCIRQRLFVEKAYELLLAYLLHNPYEEDIYEGELLDKATEVDDALITKYEAIIVEIIDSAEEFINEHEWVCEEEKANIRNQ